MVQEVGDSTPVLVAQKPSLLPPPSCCLASAERKESRMDKCIAVGNGSAALEVIDLRCISETVF